MNKEKKKKQKLEGCKLDLELSFIARSKSQKFLQAAKSQKQEAEVKKQRRPEAWSIPQQAAEGHVFSGMVVWADLARWISTACASV